VSGAHGADADAREDRDGGLEDIYWRDEILQLMYWLRGEGLLEEVTPDDLRRVLAADPGRLAARLARLAADGYVEPGDAPRYRLSPRGIEEGRRRFVDEFAPFLGRQDHLACGDPACDCPTSGGACPRLPHRPQMP
jgi:hypothetical protein